MDDRRRNIFIDLLEQVRKNYEVRSERQLAKMLGVTSTHLRRWTKERVGTPKPELYEKMAQLLHMTMDEFYARLNGEELVKSRCSSTGCKSVGERSGNYRTIESRESGALDQVLAGIDALGPEEIQKVAIALLSKIIHPSTSSGITLSEHPLLHSNQTFSDTRVQMTDNDEISYIHLEPAELQRLSVLFKRSKEILQWAYPGHTKSLGLPNSVVESILFPKENIAPSFRSDAWETIASLCLEVIRWNPELELNPSETYENRAQALLVVLRRDFSNSQKRPSENNRG